MQVVAVAIQQGRTRQLWQVEIRRREDKKLIAYGSTTSTPSTQPEMDALLVTAPETGSPRSRCGTSKDAAIRKWDGAT